MKTQPVFATFAPAFSAAEVPKSIMVMPGGRNEISATQGGRPVRLVVDVGPDAADAMERTRLAIAANLGQRPFFDFDHENKAASGWPTRFFWQEGDRPGVYAEVEWSAAGREAIAGRNYRSFSPMFYKSKGSPSRVVPYNPELHAPQRTLGTLTNDPAFSKISPVFAKASDGPASNQKHDPMKKQKQLLALLTAVSALQAERLPIAAKADTDTTKAADLATKDSAIAAKLAEVQALRPEAEAELANATEDEAVAARDARIEVLEAQAKVDAAERARLSEQVIAAKRTEADAVLAKFADRIPPANTTLTEYWRKQLIADPVAAKAAIEAIPVSAAFGGRVVKTGGTGDTTAQVGLELERGLLAYAASEGCENPGDRIAVAARRGELWRNLRKPFMDDPIAAGSVATRLINRASRGELPVAASNSLGTLAANIVVQQSLEFLKLQFPILSAISTDFSAQAVKWNQTLDTRIIGTRTVQTYTGGAYADAAAVTTDVSVTMDHHFYDQVSFNVQELGATVRDLVGEQKEALHYSLGKGIVDFVYTKLTAANYLPGSPSPASNKAGQTVSTKANFGRQTLIDASEQMGIRGVPEEGRTLLLASSYANALKGDTAYFQLAVMSQAYRGDNSVLGKGQLVQMETFNPMVAYNLPANDLFLVGAGFRKSALALVSRIPSDITQAMPGTPVPGLVFVVTNPDTGMSVLVTQFVDLVNGNAKMRVELMVGAAPGQLAAMQLFTSK